jgi:transcriptional regulator with XRE-family HTH domain
MGAQKFGQLVEAERLKRRWTRSKLAVAVGILEDGTALDATQIRRIIEGTRKLDQDTVQRIIEALDLDEEQAWFLSGLWPPDLDIDGYRAYRHHLAAVGAIAEQGNPRTGRSWRRAGDRRRRDRRHLRLVPSVAA